MVLLCETANTERRQSSFVVYALALGIFPVFAWHASFAPYEAGFLHCSLDHLLHVQAFTTQRRDSIFELLRKKTL